MEVSFEEENRYAPSQSIGSQKKGLSAFVIRTGLAKDETGAQQVLLTALIISIVTIGIVWFFARSEPTLSPEEYLEQAGRAGQIR